MLIECLNLRSDINLRSFMVLPHASVRPESTCLSSLERLDLLSVHFSSVVQIEWTLLDRQLAIYI